MPLLHHPARLALGLSVLVFIAIGDSSACAPAWRDGGPKVSIATEEALIVWDDATKTQYFTRRSTFDTRANDFAFLVPTPTPLKETDFFEVDDELFKDLGEWTKPRVHAVRILRGSRHSRMSVGTTKSAPPGGMAVEEFVNARVGGFQVVSLRATDRKALVEWLRNQGYATRPEADAWFDHYIAKKWTINAYKVAQPEHGASRTSTRSLCLKFQTNKPFYPYHEPADMRLGPPTSRLLRLYVLALRRPSGVIGEPRVGAPKGPFGANGFDNPWRFGKTLFSQNLLEHQTNAIAARLKEKDAHPVNWGSRLTKFEDEDSPRSQGTDDVYFRFDQDQSPVAPPPEIREEFEPENLSSHEIIQEQLTIGSGVAVGLVLVLLLGVMVYFVLAGRTSS